MLHVDGLGVRKIRVETKTGTPATHDISWPQLHQVNVPAKLLPNLTETEPEKNLTKPGNGEITNLTRTPPGAGDFMPERLGISGSMLVFNGVTQTQTIMDWNGLD